MINKDIRDRRWIKRNQISTNIEYIKSLCNQIGFNEKQYNIGFFYSEDAVYISQGLFSYVIVLDWDNACLNIWENSQLGDNKYHKLNISFKKDSAWYESLQWVYNRKTKKIK